MNIVKTHHDCYESPNPEVDFDQINDKYLQSEVIKNESQQVYTIYKVKPEKSEGLVETNEERLNRLKAELFELKEEVEFLADKEKLFNGSSDEEELNLLKEIKKLQDEMMEIAKSNGIDSILSNAFQNQANFEQNMKFLDQQNQKKHLENIFSKIDV